jgi:hypothetical protein
MKQINFYGLARSGNHAVIFWILHNLSKEIVEISKHQQIYADKEKRVCFVNNAINCISDFRNKFDASSYTYVLKSYEDIDGSEGFVIVRDFLNLVCSRYKHYGEALAYRSQYCVGLENVIALWKKHVLSSEVVSYNGWLNSKEYRDKVGEKLDIPNINDKTDYVSTIGNGSSFGGVRLFDKDNYLRRYQQIKLPQHMIDIILGDFELVRINSELFQIDLENLR